MTFEYTEFNPPKHLMSHISFDVCYENVEPHRGKKMENVVFRYSLYIALYIFELAILPIVSRADFYWCTPASMHYLLWHSTGAQIKNQISK